MLKHQNYIDHCFKLAKKSKNLGNTAVGAIIVKEEVVIAEGLELTKTLNDITQHAEINAIKNALKTLSISDLTKTILYTTHEPCIMCAYAIRHYGIKKVIYVNKVGEIGSINGKFKILENNTLTKWSSTPITLQYKEYH